MFDRKQLRAHIEPVIESFFRRIYFWTETEEEFGALLIYTHVAGATAIGLTLVASFLFPLPPTICMGLILVLGVMVVQYTVLGACVMSRLEKRINGRPYPILEPLLRFYNIPIEAQHGVIYLISSILLAVLLLLFLRSSLFTP